MNSANSLLDQYRAAVIEHYQATIEGRFHDTNATNLRLMQLREEIFVRTPESWKLIEPNLRDADPRVRLDAACALLPKKPRKAWWILKRFSLLVGGHLGLLAQMRLHVWKTEGR